MSKIVKIALLGAIVAGISTLLKSDRVGALKKSTWRPPYKSLGVKELGWKSITNFRHAQGKTGVYIIKKNGVIIYIGAGRNVYKTMLRHFEEHKGTCYSSSDNCNKQRYFDDYDKNEYLVRVILTNTPKQAFSLETALINKYKPQDNTIIPELFDADKKMQSAMTAQKAENFDKPPF